MSLNDVLANALSKINIYEQRNKRECILYPISKLLVRVLEIMKDNNYIGDFEIIKTNRGDYIKVNLLGHINKCNAIKPRFPVSKDEYNEVEKRYLPSKGFGIIIVSTPKGVMTHKEALKNNLGGRLIAYCY